MEFMDSGLKHHNDVWQGLGFHLFIFWEEHLITAFSMSVPLLILTLFFFFFF